MARPRLHSPELMLDVAEKLAVDGGPAAVTVRAVAEHSGASSGSIYHAFPSREALLAAMWLRAARRFMDLQRDAVDRALQAGGPDAPVQAVLQAALSLRQLQRAHKPSARLLIDVRRESLLGEEVPADLVKQLRALDAELTTLLRTVAGALWDREDRIALETVAVCVVDLPAALLIPKRRRVIDTEPLLEAAVRATLAAPLAPPR